jgi:Flp pilus assembly pilin Flp
MRKFEEARGAALKKALERGGGSGRMSNVFKFLNDVHKDEGGAALVEYTLLVGFIAIVCIIAVTQLGLAISGSLSTSCASLGGTSC